MVSLLDLINHDLIAFKHHKFELQSSLVE